MPKALLILALLASAPALAAPDCVVLLHGLSRTSASMAPLEAGLADAGYAVVNVDYPSRHHPVVARSG